MIAYILCVFGGFVLGVVVMAMMQAASGDAARPMARPGSENWRG